MKRVIPSLIILTASLALAGCSGGTKAPAASSEPAAAAPATSEAATTATPTEEVDEVGDIAEGGLALTEVPWGGTGRYSSVGLGFPKGEGETDVQLTNWECDEAGEIPTLEGKKICLFEVKLTNAGKAAYQADEPGAVRLTNGEIHEPNAADQEVSWRTTESESGTYVMDLNPGDSFTYYHAVSIPKEDQPEALLYPASTYVAVPTMALQLG